MPKRSLRARHCTTTPFETLDLKRGRARSIVFAITFTTNHQSNFSIVSPLSPIHSSHLFLLLSSQALHQSCFCLFLPNRRQNANCRAKRVKRNRDFMSEHNAPLFAYVGTPPAHPRNYHARNGLRFDDFSASGVTIQGSCFSFSLERRLTAARHGDIRYIIWRRLC
jgi:hypothetical protein